MPLIHFVAVADPGRRPSRRAARAVPLPRQSPGAGRAAMLMVAISCTRCARLLTEVAQDVEHALCRRFFEEHGLGHFGEPVVGTTAQSPAWRWKSIDGNFQCSPAVV
mmetsp:Transcript_25780/g.74209  ORF Transcript_25780/g.74209 Transcript_25780/m.74209 type:complete len:107 (+) Transcript_25780:1205-1525(+)